MDVAGPSRDARSVKGKTKSAHWTEDEKIELVHEIDKRKRIIRDKFNSIITKAAKKKAWEEIASVVNSRYPATKRSVPQLKKQWQNVKQRSRNEFRLAQEGHTQTGAGRNTHDISPLAQAVLDVVGVTNPNLLGVEGGIDTDEPSTAGAGVHPVAVEMVPGGRALTYDIEVGSPGPSYLELPDYMEDTDEYEVSDWLAPAEEPAPVAQPERGATPAAAAAAAPTAQEECREVLRPTPEAGAAAAASSADVPRPRPRRAWRPASPAVATGTATRAADKQYYKDLLAQQEGNIQLERECLLRKLDVVKEQARTQQLLQEAAIEVLESARAFRVQSEAFFNELRQVFPTNPEG